MTPRNYPQTLMTLRWKLAISPDLSHQCTSLPLYLPYAAHFDLCFRLQALPTQCSPQLEDAVRTSRQHCMDIQKVAQRGRPARSGGTRGGIRADRVEAHVPEGDHMHSRKTLQFLSRLPKIFWMAYVALLSKHSKTRFPWMWRRSWPKTCDTLHRTHG